ncbi:MAG: NAD-dependent epimerase/dehydratase family protein [Pseudomonadota bacterium]
MAARPIVALTGATGFIGPYVIAAFRAAGYEVRALARRPMTDRPGVHWVKGDIHDMAALQQLALGAKVFVHGAGAIKARRHADFARINVEGSALAATSARAAGVERFLLLSSLAARAPHLSPYAASKRASERAIAESLGDAVAWTVLRPPAVYGPGDGETLKIFRAARWGLAPLPAHGARASWIFAEDLAQAIVHAAAAPDMASRTLGLDDGAGGHALIEVYRTAGAILGRRVRPFVVPSLALAAIGLANEGLARLGQGAPMLTRGKARELGHPDWCVDRPTLADVSPWRPRVALAEGLARTLGWYRQQGLL